MWTNKSRRNEGRNMSHNAATHPLVVVPVPAHSSFLYMPGVSHPQEHLPLLIDMTDG